MLLNGTSSAGKTSIMKELRSLYGQSWEYVIGDEFVETYTPQEPIEESLDRDEQNKRVMKAMFSSVKQLSDKGLNVFVDTVEFDHDYDYYCSILDCNTTIKILVYCPLDILVHRGNTRNTSDQPNEHRPLNLSFWQFTKIYAIQQSENQPVIDRIKPSRMLSALAAASQEVRKLMTEAGMNEQEIKNNITLFTTPFIDQFKLNETNEVILTTQHTWDLVVNSGVQSSSEIA